MRIVAETARHHDIRSLHLEGGTALSAYFLGHRESEDLDFFGDPDFHALGFLGVLSPVLADSGFSLEPPGSRFVSCENSTKHRSSRVSF